MGGTSINVADLVVLGVLLASGLLAFSRGLVHEALSVGAWVGAGLVALYGFPYARPLAHRYIGMPMAADAVAGIGLFLVSLVLFALVTRAISARIRNSALNSLDRSLGFVFGLVRGAALVCLAYLALIWALPPAEHPVWLREARTLPLIAEGARWLRALAPAELAGAEMAVEQAGDKIRRLNENSRIYQNILQPEPGSKPSGKAPASRGYNTEERRDMDRLMNSTQ